MKTKILGLLAVGLLAGPLTATAVSMPHAYRLEFSGIQGGMGGTVPTELQSMAATLMVDFDPLFSMGLSSAALVFDSAYQNSLFGPDFYYRYEATTIPNVMTIGDECIGAVQLLCSFTLGSGNDLVISFSFSEAGAPLSAGIQFRVNGNDYRSTASTVREMNGTSVPEPGTLALLASGIVGLGLSRRRKAN